MVNAIPHPLAVWRKAHTVVDPESQHVRPMTMVEAAIKYGIPYPTWASWERWKADGGRIPDARNMARISEFTDGAITANHFYGLELQPNWRDGMPASQMA